MHLNGIYEAMISIDVEGLRSRIPACLELEIQPRPISGRVEVWAPRSQHRITSSSTVEATPVHIHDLQSVTPNVGDSGRKLNNLSTLI